MFKFIVDEISKLGDFDQKYGQSYWGKVSEEDVPIMFNSMEDLEITPDTPIIHITAEERVEKQSAKGNNYYRLKKVKVVGGVSAHNDPTTAPPTPRGANPNVGYIDQILERIIQLNDKVDTLTAMITDTDGFGLAQPSQLQDPIVEDIPDEPLDLDDIPFGEAEQKERFDRAIDEGEAQNPKLK